MREIGQKAASFPIYYSSGGVYCKQVSDSNLRYLIQGVKVQNRTEESGRLTFGKPLTMVAANQFFDQL
jgi:hypothetical protein